MKVSFLIVHTQQAQKSQTGHKYMTQLREVVFKLIDCKHGEGQRMSSVEQSPPGLTAMPAQACCAQGVDKQGGVFDGSSSGIHPGPRKAGWHLPDTYT